MGRPVLLLLGTQHSVPQQRRRNLHRRHAQGRALRRSECAGARAAPCSTTTATAISISSSATTSSLIPTKTACTRRIQPSCQWKGMPVDVRPARPSPATPTSSITTTATEPSPMSRQKAGILKPGPRYSITAVSYDFDNDGWPDIYVAVDSEPSILFHNNHDGTFTDIAVMAGCAYSDNGHEQAGMGVGVADYDCDGWFDIFKTNFADDTCNLYHNNGDGTFSDVTFSSGHRNQQSAMSPGAAALSTTTTTAGPTSFRSTATCIPRSTGTISVRPSRIRAWSTRIWATDDSKMFPPRWAPASPSILQPRRRVRRLRQRRRHRRADLEHERPAVSAAQRWRQQAELDQDQTGRNKVQSHRDRRAGTRDHRQTHTDG